MWNVELAMVTYQTTMIVFDFFFIFGFQVYDLEMVIVAEITPIETAGVE